MARKGYGRQDSLLNTSTYPDDDSYPIGSNEWNKNPKTDGVFGFTKATSGISSNGVTITDSYVEVTDAGTIHKILPSTTALPSANYGSGTDGASTSIKSFGEGDLIYVVKANGVGTVTLNHQQSGVTDGKINTLSEVPITLDENIPKIFMCRNKDQAGNLEWFEYGGGAQTTPTDITVADESSDTTCFPLFVTAATGDLAPKSGSNLAFNSSSGILTATGFAGALTGAVTGNADTATSATTATTATNVTVADESSDTSCNVLFTTAATGNLPPKSGTNLTFNSSSGLLTATLFAGDLTGAVTGNADTATSATTATTATNVTVADESSDTSCNVLFTTAATGNLPPKSGTNLTFNSDTGVLSAVGLTLSGDLTVNGTTTTINSTVLEVADKLIEIAKVGSPSNSTADGGGILIEGGGDGDKTITWTSSTGDFDISENVDIASGKIFKVNGVSTLTATALGGAVVGSSLTSVGTLVGLTMGGAIAMGGNDITNGGVIFLTQQAEAEADVTDKGQIWVDTATPNTLMFTNDEGTDFDLTAGGGASATHAYTNQSSTTYYGTGSSGTGIDRDVAVGTEASGAGEREIYIKQIDSNNEGVFTVIHKNGSTVEVQIA